MKKLKICVVEVVAALSLHSYGNQNVEVGTWSCGLEVHIQKILLIEELRGLGVALGNVSEFY